MASVKNKILSFIKNTKLKNIVEKTHFIYDKGELYCIRENCVGCKYREGCEFDTFNELEETLNKSTRNNIRFGEVKNKYEWYLPHINSLEDFEYVKRVNGRYIPKVQLNELPVNIKKRLVLSEAFTNIHKKILEIKGIKSYSELNDFILYRPDDRSYYCIKTSCNFCELKDRCKSELVERGRELLYVAVDSSSQEPEIITYLSQEPQYVEIFTNHSLVDIDYLLEPVNELFETKYGIDTTNNSLYSSFLDYLGFNDKTLLYNFCVAYYKSVRKLDLKDLESNAEPIIDKYIEFKKLVKKGDIYIK